ncbi:C6 zinc finger domain protein [Aspergillus novofumigatus IBT 16806]|uniref:C6 zinc finger domain protein n=1 Tax=Aspergillus novofumigatus (strain IBT 16806) TaxID=1392255 RepID=A0A2I1BYJ2_ASPN1|nr:C6 zinc finger domain protein [Aspergillus novofumigatus IBT 16806]PKX90440.1 C6 zinc finger domain protein [Aspergillus novofumigatus IBT 16806]
MATSYHSHSTQSTRAPAADTTEASRPRRKKARRACSACQKSHQTCGNERPCQSCVRRGCADSCRDGERKKPKYLEEGSYRVFTIEYNVPCRNNCAPMPLNHTFACKDTGVQSRTPSPDAGQTVYPYGNLNPWTICAEDPFVGLELDDAQIKLEDQFLLDSPQCDTTNPGPQTDAVLAFAIGSGWSSTFLQSEYEDSV